MNKLVCSNWAPGPGGPVNIHARALGRLGRGKKKRLSREELARRASQLERVRCLRWRVLAEPQDPAEAGRKLHAALEGEP